MAEAWQRVFDKDFVAGTLTRAGLYLLAYELLKDSIIRRTREFFWIGFKDGKDIVNPKYTQILSKHKNPLIASCMWLEESGALSPNDIKTVIAIRDFRNDIAHELPSLLLDGTRDIHTEHVVQIHQLLAKIDRWWIINVELATDEEYAGQDVDENEVKSGNMILIEHLLSLLDVEPTKEANGRSPENIQGAP